MQYCPVQPRPLHQRSRPPPTVTVWGEVACTRKTGGQQRRTGAKTLKQSNVECSFLRGSNPPKDALRNLQHNGANRETC